MIKVLQYAHRQDHYSIEMGREWPIEVIQSEADRKLRDCLSEHELFRVSEVQIPEESSGKEYRSILIVLPPEDYHEFRKALAHLLFVCKMVPAVRTLIFPYVKTLSDLLPEGAMDGYTKVDLKF